MAPLITMHVLFLTNFEESQIHPNSDSVSVQRLARIWSQKDRKQCVVLVSQSTCLQLPEELGPFESSLGMGTNSMSSHVSLH